MSNELREFNNSSLRCTVITNFSQNDVLYDIFYRLNSGSVPLATQELRQVLNRGEFANFLIDKTNQKQPLHSVLNLEGPDKRLRDVEILLRLIAFRLFPKNYNGNLKKFLDDTMHTINNEWAKYEQIVEQAFISINESINYLADVFGSPKKVGRKATNGELESRFNRIVFEVQIYYFMQMDLNSLQDYSQFMESFKNLTSNNPDFRSSIESSTKTIENYKIRYEKFEELINNSFGLNLKLNPFV